MATPKKRSKRKAQTRSGAVRYGAQGRTEEQEIHIAILREYVLPLLQDARVEGDGFQPAGRKPSRLPISIPKGATLVHIESPRSFTWRSPRSVDG